MRLQLRDTSLLAAGAVLSGLLAYAFFAMTTRALGSEAAAPVSVLWTYWSFSAAAFTFPIQHWVARAVAAHRDENDLRFALPRLSVVVAVTALVIAVASWFARDQLFHRGGVAFPLLVLGVTVGSAVMGLTRGTLTARRQFGRLTAVLVAENAVRCVGAAVLLVTGVDSPVVFGIALLVGHLVVLGWPGALRLRPASPRVSTESALRILSAASGGQLLSQAVLTGGPVLLALGGGGAVEVTAMFAGLALFRAPYTFALGLVSQLTGVFTTWAVERRLDLLSRARTVLIVAAGAVVAVGAVLGATIGPGLIRLVFGDDVRLHAHDTALVAAGSSVALANLVLGLLVLALGRADGVARSWTGALVVGAVVFAALPVDTALDRTCWTFLAAQVAAFGLLMVEQHRGMKRLPTTTSSEGAPVAPDL